MYMNDIHLHDMASFEELPQVKDTRFALYLFSIMEDEAETTVSLGVGYYSLALRDTL